MILEYSYEKAMKVLELFKESKIVRLDITETENGITVMEYKLIDEYPSHVRKQINRTLSEAMPRRLQLIELLNNFIITKSVNEEIHLNLHFNAVSVKKCRIDFSYTGNLLKTSDEQNSLAALNVCLERVDNIITSMGVSSQKLDVFRKEGNGRGKKYIPLTLKDFCFVIRKALEE